MPPERRHMLAVSPELLGGWLGERGQPSYRLGQVLDWVWRKRAQSFDEMSNLPLDLRTALAVEFTVGRPTTAESVTSRDGRTGKLLLELADGERVECVRMVEDRRVALCVSSQAGCGLGCRFCATGAAGAGRDLTSHEMLGQVLCLADSAWPANIVLMGMGEPLLNVDAVLEFVAALTDPRRGALGARRITVSTAGITPGIRTLAESGLRPNLALSLNSPFDEQRSELMPVNRRHPLREVLAACREYGAATGRRLLLEYVLMAGVNDSPEAARAVARVATRMHALVNLIPLNPVEGIPFRPPDTPGVKRFRAGLESAGAQVTERYRRGRDIAAGCGQLRAGRGCAGPHEEGAHG
jgi:23S rRNA (adenine2503-C2)-methyltransferase